ncbi:MAG: hypothetical protein CMJ48_08805 [Planctomycetaceae bacterium]|nr:hypothetical protein [Planctomycetaceae bacterium]
MTAATFASPPKLPRVAPHEGGMDAGRLRVIDEIVREAIKRERMPGAVVLVAHRGKVVYFQAFGHKQLVPEKVPMTRATVFDMASLTKPVATATSIMKLLETKKIELRDPVAKYIPGFAANGKQEITIYQLLTHQGGLIPDNSIKDYKDGPTKAFERINALKLYAPIGSRFVYTDVGFIVLAKIVEEVTGQNVHEFSQQQVFGPLGMSETGYLPAEALRARAATTQERDKRWMKGEVHDPRAYLLGGIAGHAGLFSTAEDLAVYAQMMIEGGQYHDVRILESATVERMTKGYEVPGSLRGLGWDVRSGYSSNRGDFLSKKAFGHGGFTGTAMWIDPQLELSVIFLSNRVHPNGKGSVNTLAGRIGTIAAVAISEKPAAVDATKPTTSTGEVLTGIDVLQKSKFAVLRGRRVGLITNHTGVNREGVGNVEILHNAPEVKLVALFSPEHGFAGKLDVRTIGDSKDETTGLKIHSLYGKTRTPSDESLEGIDTLVFDIQDIGARFYTFVSTMGNAMQAAAKKKIRFVVLDRPNPIGGVDVAGPVLDAGSESFVGFHRIPVRHGMTVGELATMFNAELKLGLDLHVVRVAGWRRSDLYDATGLAWINPSPNMRNLTQALLYPGIGLLETTNLSVGRGTDTPFEIIGAPWLDGRKLARAVNALGLPGLRCVPIAFTPESSKFKDESCGGVNFVITDRAEFQSVRTGLEVARQLRRLFPEDWSTKSYNRLLSNRRTFEAVVGGKSVDEVEVVYGPELEGFLKRRAGFLVYE